MIIRTDKQQTTLRWAVDEVLVLKPGQCIDMSERVLADIGCHEHNGATFTPPDQVLENILGAAWEYGYDRIPQSRAVRFYRLPKPLDYRGSERSYVSPDRRQLLFESTL